MARSESGIPELVTSGGNGLIVDGRDYDAWADQLVGLWQDSERWSQLSRAARETVRERFTTEITGRQVHDLFAKVAAELASGEYERPPSLHWGVDRSPTGDVLPAPSLFRPTALSTYPGLR